MTYTVKDILKIQVAPALGCTEPVAIALGAAAAVSLLDNRDIESIELWVSPNIYKNGLAVSIPGTRGLSGIDLSCAIGAFGGDAKLKLEVLEPVDQAAIDRAAGFVKDGKVTVNILTDRTGLFIRTVVKSGKVLSESVISELHDNIVSLKLDGREITENPLLSIQGKQDGKSELALLEEWLREQTLSDLLDLVDDFDAEDLTFIEEGVEVNARLAEYGLKHGPGLGIGKAIQRLIRQKLLTKDMVISARMLTAAAADARMSGVKLPAMSSAGSGNHGITAILPIWALRDYIEHDRETMLRAIGLSHIITAYVKSFTGRLSAVCGCSVAAGAGATAGTTYLLGGNVNHIAGAIKNLTEDLAGVICDGAKGGCAVKLVTAAGAAVLAAHFSLQGVHVEATDGIIGNSPEQTMKNVGILSTQGMIETDRTILKIMVDKKFSVS